MSWGSGVPPPAGLQRELCVVSQSQTPLAVHPPTGSYPGLGVKRAFKSRSQVCAFIVICVWPKPRWHNVVLQWAAENYPVTILAATPSSTTGLAPHLLELPCYSVV